jgi:hypothetical protein
MLTTGTLGGYRSISKININNMLENLRTTMSRTSIPKQDLITLIDLLKDFEAMCLERNIKFNKYTADQMMDFLRLYKSYRAGVIDPPPF